VLLAELVRTSQAVGATRSRLAKRAALALLLRALSFEEVPIAIGFLTGNVRQRTGVGWSGAWSIEVTAAADESLTLGDVDGCFDRLEATSGAGSQSERAELLRGLFAQATEPEQILLRQLIIGEVRTGALAGVVADAVADAAEVGADELRRAAMMSGSLAVAATAALFGGADALGAIGLKVLNPIQPMLASPASGVAEAVADAAPEMVSVEWKLDGIRVQVHRDGDEVRIFTRNLNDVTARLPEVVSLVCSLPSSRLILDGELIGLSEDDAPRLFQDTAGSFATEQAATYSLRPFFFDCMHADGVDLIDEPLQHRQEELERCAGAYRLPTLHTTSADEAAAFSDAALAAGHEGVMVKTLTSTYEAGRRGKAWRKVKPVRSLDLIVLAAEWGHGRRQGWLSNLHLGACDPDGGPPIMVGKTFKGMTDVLLRWQTEALQALMTRTTSGTVFVRPELVIEIALDGVQRSTRYPGGVALRFARVTRYRPDKAPEDADTIDAVRALLAR
jgi:DNA ligase 1